MLRKFKGGSCIVAPGTILNSSPVPDTKTRPLPMNEAKLGKITA